MRKAVAAAFAKGAGEHERGRNPRAAGDAGFGERAGEQNSSAGGGEITAADEKFVEKTFRHEQRRIIFHESRAELGAGRLPDQQRAAGVDDDGFARAAPDGEVGGGIAGVVKSAFAEFCDERLELVSAAQIGFAVAAENFIEEAGVSRRPVSPFANRTRWRE